MMKHVVAIAFGISTAVFHAQCLAAGKDWYPKGNDLCAEYLIKLLKRDPRFGHLVTPTKDPAIAKYVADYNAATGTNDKGGLAVIALAAYCNTHATTKLGDVTAQAVIANWNASEASSLTQPLPVDTSALETWYRQNLATCPASDEECKRIAKKTYDDSIACKRGDAKACGDRDNDLIEIGRWNTEQRSRAAQPNPQNALFQCLQSTAMSVLKSCQQTGCTADVGYETIHQAQLAFCGYSSIQPIQSSQPLNPNLTNCFTTPAAGGGWITTCTQF